MRDTNACFIAPGAEKCVRDGKRGQSIGGRNSAAGMAWRDRRGRCTLGPVARLAMALGLLTALPVARPLRADLPGVRSLHHYLLAGVGLVSQRLSTVAVYGGFFSSTLISDSVSRKASPERVIGFGLSEPVASSSTISP